MTFRAAFVILVIIGLPVVGWQWYLAWFEPGKLLEMTWWMAPPAWRSGEHEARRQKLVLWYLRIAATAGLLLGLGVLALLIFSEIV